MRISELLTEVKAGKISKRAQQSSRGINTYGDIEHANSDYVGFKLGQAMAMSDGSGAPLNINPKSWYGKKKTVHPYSEVEQQMFKDAAKVVGASYKDINKGDMRSKELDSTHTVSPVPDRKKLAK
jgi:hypothetical protein